MKPEKRDLIHDLLDNNANHDDILRAAGSVLRHRRRRRLATQVAGLLATFALLAVVFLRRDVPQTKSAPVANVATKAAPAPEVKALTDEQLLSMFPSNTPVGIASLADGRKRLIFPRPGDEERFITRL